MKKVKLQGNQLTGLTEKELNEFFGDEKEFELIKAKDGLIVLQEIPAQALDKESQRIIDLLWKKSLSERVEGSFEKFLSKEELKKFEELLKAGKVEKFKLSPKYKKAIYQLPEQRREREQKEIPKSSPPTDYSKTVFVEKPISQYYLNKDGFQILEKEQDAKNVSEALREKMQKNEVKGIKSFDNLYYLVKTDLYELLREKILNAFRQNPKSSCADLSQKTQTPKLLVKLVCEFLKEEGEIIEKRKEQFEAVN